MESRKVILYHKRALGDELMFTAGVRDFKILFPDIAINIETSYRDLWANNPYLDTTLTRRTSGVGVYRVGYPLIQNSNATFNHFTFAFLMDIITNLGGVGELGMSLSEFTSAFSRGRVGDGEPKLHETKEPFKSYRHKFKSVSSDLFRQCGDLHLTPSERSNNFIRDTYGEGRYWVVAPGGKRDCTCKIWDWRRFQRVIDHFKGHIKFIVIGKSDHLLESLRDVIDLRDRLTIRDIVTMTYHAEGCVSGVSFLMHLAAALPYCVDINSSRLVQRDKPCVAIYGGREPPSFTGYSSHNILHTGGSFTCCDMGGCWHSRVIPINKNKQSDDKDNKRLCTHPVPIEGRMIPACMEVFDSEDIIRAIEIYYSGNVITLSNYKNIKRRPMLNSKLEIKEINFLASLQSKGGGEQSAIKIVEVLRRAGWKVNFYAWDKVHSNYKDVIEPCDSFRGETFKISKMKKNIPLFFYANDQINDFCNESITGELVKNSSGVVIGINFINGKLPSSAWLKSKLLGVVFQNKEKLEEFKSQVLYPLPELVSLYGAISIEEYLGVTQKKRSKEEPLVVLKHCCPDYRKYVTQQSKNGGDKVHIWQKNIIKEVDTEFYKRFLKDIKNIRFEFMEAHSELQKAFEGESRMVFHKWDAMPVKEFLAKGHVYLYRSSNMWRDNYPRCVAEALASGMPVLSEPRDGTADRIVHGDTGFYCIDYDAYIYALKLLVRKESYRFQMGTFSKQWARDNLDPEKWLDVLSNLFQI